MGAAGIAAWCGVVLGTAAGGLGSGSAARRGSTGPRYVVGVLSVQRVRVCKKYREEWTQPHLEAGFTWLVGIPFGMKVFAGEMVVVEGRRVSRPAAATRGDGRCPIAQMRGDHVPGWRGLRVRRPGMGRVPAFRFRKIGIFTGLKVRLQGRKVEARLRNTFRFPLPGVEIRVHCEGCGGKPLSFLRATRRRILPPGGLVASTFPTVLRNPLPGRSPAAVAASVQVVSSSPRVYFDLDVPLSRFGVRVACPQRRP